MHLTELENQLCTDADGKEAHRLLQRIAQVRDGLTGQLTRPHRPEEHARLCALVDGCDAAASVIRILSRRFGTDETRR